MESPFACDMSAIPPEERGEHLAAIQEVFGAVREIREIPDGYSFRLENETTWLTKAVDFIATARAAGFDDSTSW